jgi:hypothetical protein
MSGKIEQNNFRNFSIRYKKYSKFHEILRTSWCLKSIEINDLASNHRGPTIQQAFHLVSINRHRLSNCFSLLTSKQNSNTIFSSFQFVAAGVFKAELNEFLTRELAEDGYSGVEVRVTPSRTEIIIMATRTQNVLGEKGRRIRELTAVVQKR